MFKREPARILSLVSAVIALAIGFGLPLTSEQVGLIMAVVVVLVGEGTRSRVTPTASVPQMIANPRFELGDTTWREGRITER